MINQIDVKSGLEFLYTMNTSIKAILIIVFLNTLITVSSYANEQAKVCTACHGLNGISNDPTVPKLAGQHKNYLASQLNALKVKREKTPL